MEWKMLSKSAKNILEWLENPATHERELLHIGLNSEFVINSQMGGVREFITEELWSEIYEYCFENKKEINMKKNSSSLYISLRAPGMVFNKKMIN